MVARNALKKGRACADIIAARTTKENRRDGDSKWKRFAVDRKTAVKDGRQGATKVAGVMMVRQADAQ